ncbi:uracil-DNA glycosylase [Sulfolobus sp. S-194]|uniref:uracil-DNA glycosylase n=1 Tax=Sulfolobus sp. S-194 TaxID=2512240 RepID=UPI0014373024|nr:uracil-DNA glycosylase [Sulfolobus sp. S-194]QIW25184.1 uracil-DNA glycosylase [Sulfolobus sp. S-194]
MISILYNEIVSCSRCERLVEYRKNFKIPPRFVNWNYWNKPVPGFGDEKAKILIVGLAPALHGGNRTGRVFTGDESGKWVIKGLYSLGLSNKEEGKARDDGLEVKEVYLTNAVKCAPPKNKPLKEEILNCSKFLIEEIKLLQIKVILALGRIAFDTILSLYGIKSKFYHGIIVKLPDNKILIGSYHPSAQNTKTGRLKWEDWVKILKLAYEIANNPQY